MLDKDERREIGDLLKEKGIPNKKLIFDTINQGATRSIIDVMIAEQMAILESQKPKEVILNKNPAAYEILGRSLIAQNAIEDMNAVMSLPYVYGGALMPDAHRVKENHVPVGGVVVSDAVIPGIVGADISCSVQITLIDQEVDDDFFVQFNDSLQYVLRNFTYFGHQVNPHNEFNPRFTPIMRTTLGTDILNRAYRIPGTQFGTSGDGNHFVEFGWTQLFPTKGRDGVKINASKNKRYFAILSHFGSRSMGSTIANAFIEHAQEKYNMPNRMEDAPLDMDQPIGKDYWDLMQYAGSFAEQGHRWLHQSLIMALAKRKVIYPSLTDTIYTRHNFAWQTSEGIVHRKGATPAHLDELGVIPATMGHKSQIVSGLGDEKVFNSASHGAGRTHSRGQALQAFKGTHEFVKKEYGVTLIGGDADEDPRAYKSITDVMEAQRSSVITLGDFTPMFVRMADPRFQRK